jgi:hypothetical protein
VKGQLTFRVRVVELVALLVVLISSGKAEGLFHYDAAVYSAGPAFTHQQRLALFPLTSAGNSSVPMPFPIGLFVIGSNGKALYAQRGLESPGTVPAAGVFKIEFNPTRASLIPRSTAFRSIFSFAVSPRQDRIVISGRYWDGSQLTCGVFQLEVAGGSVSQVLKAPDCDRTNARTYLSFSPDSTLIAAIYHQSLELIDLARQTTRSVEGGFYKAEWYPDGKWIAALEHSDRERTALFDARSLKKERLLETSDLHWSPDSRYLIAWKWQAACGPEIYSLQKIEVETGKASVIESSRCKLVGGSSGWIDSSVGQ